jgi:hypothetical protein
MARTRIAGNNSEWAYRVTQAREYGPLRNDHCSGMPAQSDQCNHHVDPLSAMIENALLTSFKPLDQVASNDPLFFVDLSPYGPESYPALVASYKAQLVSAPPTGLTTWKPETLQWAFAAGAIVYPDAKKVAEGIKKHFEDWIKGQGRSPWCPLSDIAPAAMQWDASARSASSQSLQCRVTQ